MRGQEGQREEGSWVITIFPLVCFRMPGCCRHAMSSKPLGCATVVSSARHVFSDMGIALESYRGP